MTSKRFYSNFKVFAHFHSSGKYIPCSFPMIPVSLHGMLNGIMSGKFTSFSLSLFSPQMFPRYDVYIKRFDDDITYFIYCV